MLRLIDELTERHAERARNIEERFRLLTKREREVSDLISRGASNREIAARLAITERTVKAHLTSIFQKLGLTNRLQLGIYALQARAGTTTFVQ